MEIIEVTPEQYLQAISSPYHLFNSAPFNNLNANKCENVFYWLFREGKYRLGIIAGLKNNAAVSPFSAPFGGFSYLNNDISIQYIDKAIDQLILRFKESQILSISITLPPIFYDESFISKMLNSLFRKSFYIKTIDMNHSINLDNFGANYMNFLKGSARNKLKSSLAKGLQFIKCDTSQFKNQSYEIIRYNREVKRYSLKLSLEQIIQTSSIIPVDFFLVKDPTQLGIAAAIVFHVREREIAQVIYWGDRPEYSGNRPMNFLAFKIFEFYKHKGFKYVDIGPSSENSIPYHGVCEFKESIGCFVSPKISMIYGD